MAVNLLGKIAVRLSAETAEFRAGLDQARRKLQSVTKDIQKFGRKTERVGRILSKNLAAPIAAITVGLVALSNKAANAADEIDKMSIRTGLARKTLQELKFVADQTGVSFEGIQGALDGFTMRLPQMQRRGTQANEVIRRLGISLTDTDGSLRSMGDLFPEVAQALSTVENHTERSSLAMQLFGRRAKELLPMLDLGADGIEKLSERARELGLIMSDEEIRQLVAYKDAMAEIKQQFAATGRELAISLLPALRDQFIPFLQDRVIPAVRSFVDVLGNIEPKTIAVVAGVGGMLAAFSGMLMVVGQLTVALTSLASLIKISMLPLLGAGGALVVGLSALAGLWVKNRVEAAAFRRELEEFNNMSGLSGEDLIDRRAHLQSEIAREKENIRRWQDYIERGIAVDDNRKAIELARQRGIEHARQLSAVDAEMRMRQTLDGVSSGPMAAAITSRVNIAGLEFDRVASRVTSLQDRLANLKTDLAFAEGTEEATKLREEIEKTERALNRATDAARRMMGAMPAPVVGLVDSTAKAGGSAGIEDQGREWADLMEWVQRTGGFNAQEIGEQNKKFGIDQEALARGMAATIISNKGKMGGQMWGQMAGTLVGSAVPLIGTAVGGAVGGLLGGLLDKDDERFEQQITQLEAIERTQRDTIYAIEQQTNQLLNPANRLINAPADFVVPRFNPSQGSGGTVNYGDTVVHNEFHIDGGNLSEVRSTIEAVMSELLATGRATAAPSRSRL